MPKYINDKVRLLTLTGVIGENGIEGRVKLQKIVYLMQQFCRLNGSSSTFEYDFNFFKFGPFDKRVGEDATFLSNETSYFKEKMPDNDFDTWKYTCKYDVVKDKLPSVVKLFGISEDIFKEKAKVLNNQQSQLLEMASTIEYIRINDCIDNYETIKKECEKLKPHLIDKFKEAYEFLELFMQRV